ncbi:hypothetical protein N7478_010224 [Penicillium angulare]|uniref:uncharacterized protein n=1 Tax=Penicillium angulare TaxID=116970 RepID=UPI002541B660|nr:uncharacterized protein N7478_010130 [Penicillium angulare]XP_056775808.1 uncharacterized protein N7478_010224 [Penicillium angulare]KAJ5267322.1 hypothetical protein N7478_010130 [Penicillium angulare]KAJ5267416.1 hypothetical protein N7478_010224 [Penicillium angulare]
MSSPESQTHAAVSLSNDLSPARKAQQIFKILLDDINQNKLADANYATEYMGRTDTELRACMEIAKQFHNAVDALLNVKLFMHLQKSELKEEFWDQQFLSIQERYKPFPMTARVFLTDGVMNYTGLCGQGTPK